MDAVCLTEEKSALKDLVIHGKIFMEVVLIDKSQFLKETISIISTMNLC